MDNGLLIGVQTTLRQLYHLKPMPSWMTTQESWNPGALCISYRQLDMTKNLLSLVVLTSYITLGRVEVL